MQHWHILPSVLFCQLLKRREPPLSNSCQPNKTHSVLRNRVHWLCLCCKLGVVPPIDEHSTLAKHHLRSNRLLKGSFRPTTMIETIAIIPTQYFASDDEFKPTTTGNATGEADVGSTIFKAFVVVIGIVGIIANVSLCELLAQLEWKKRWFHKHFNFESDVFRFLRISMANNNILCKTV